MRFVKSLMLAGLGLSALAVLPTGCVANESSFFVDHALALAADADCQFEVDLPSYSTGTYDIGIENGGYGLAVSAANQLTSLGDADLLRTETSYIRLEGAEVFIEGLNGAPSVDAFTLPLVDTLPPSEGDDPGEGVVVFDLVPPGAITEVGTYLIHIRMFGHTLGGTPLEAGEFVWPLYVCDECLKTCLEVAPPCQFQVGGDYYHNCAFYASGCGECDAAAP